MTLRVLYVPVTTVQASQIFRLSRPDKSLIKSVNACVRLKRAGSLCKAGNLRRCELVYVPGAGGKHKGGVFYLRGPSLIECALALPE